MKTYVLTVSKKFLIGHPKSGQPTGFKEKILSGEKIHTIRDNVKHWTNIAKQVNSGLAVFSIRQWIDIPFRSKQEEIMRLNKVGIEIITFDALGWFINDIDSDYTTEQFAKNDGLSKVDFIQWFNGDFTTEKAIIHFTDFRYATEKEENFKRL